MPANRQALLGRRPAEGPAAQGAHMVVLDRGLVQVHAFYLLAVAPPLLRTAVVLSAAGLHAAGVAARPPPRDRLRLRCEDVLLWTG